VEIGEEFGVLKSGAENGFRALTSPRFGLETVAKRWARRTRRNVEGRIEFRGVG
jgi:hypothetical protein